MKSSLALLMLLAMALIMAPLLGQALPGQSEKAVDKWFKKQAHAKPKMSKIRLFIHDVASGPDPSIVPVAKANGTAKSRTQFGVVNVVDDLLTSRPGDKSEEVGYVQGVYVSASKEAVSLLVALNFVFTDAKYNGSTLSVLGRIAEFSDNREFPVLGGSGNFRLAQGIVVAKVHSADASTGNRIVECRFHVLHYG
ncbi:OLC1v1019709C1 [Oldenlandia corymbosa var. corymbosa]|uniref:Dirigent protein n=1 Tax=Oldenlandia corymbosa var. corymbosa TaxID=529605 RepID=A0AAV1EF28_OLDCO|nr:OLC1v1019709C1 [Oldenlandia corymbosa var. corymbosa]